MKKSWYEYYKNNKKINISNILLHWPYLLKIILSNPKNVLEIGCGPGDHSVFLEHLLPHMNISLLDNDKKIIATLKRRWRSRISDFFICDLTDIKQVRRELKGRYFDTIYSQGLMEHFDAKDFRKVITNLLPFTGRFIFSIPSENYPNKDFGNEILRTREELERIISKISTITCKIVPYFPDIGLRTKKLKIEKSGGGFIHTIHFLVLGSCHYLVEIEKNNFS